MQLDDADPLAEFRDDFCIPPGVTYFDGNSLGLMTAASSRTIQRVVTEWKEKGIHGWLDGDHPWITFAERIGEQMSGLVGAAPDEVIATGTTTVNLHTLVGAFYQPGDGRTRILADRLTFPSDIYALHGQVRLKGLDPKDHLSFVESVDDRVLDEKTIIDMMTPDTALALLPSVIYRSGQLLDVERLTQAANDRGIIIGFDCSHSVGAVPHYFDDWGVDFAFWCSYKYLNGGPGATAFLYLNSSYFDRTPGLPGWFGFRKEHQFDMLTEFDHERSAAGWQISSPGMLSMAPLEESLALIKRAGIAAIRGKSLRMTSYLMFLLDETVPDSYGFRVSTPRETTARGGHVAIEHEAAPRVFDELTRSGVTADLRPPNVIRLCPSPLYNRYTEVWDVVEKLKSIGDRLGPRP